MKWLSGICLLCVLLVAGTLWLRLREGVEVPVPPVAVPSVAAAADSGESSAAQTGDPERAALVAARRTCRIEALDEFVAAQRARLAAAADPARLRVLGEALLERVLCRSSRNGMAVGTPLFPTLPAAVREDLDEAEQCVRRAIELGETNADCWRILAGVLSNRITGLATALQYNGEIEGALRRAGELAPADGHVHVALGLRKLLAPKLLGHDAASALRHFEYACQALPDDERPRVFAAMAAFLQQKRMQAVEWLEQAVAVNPNNVFAQVVLRRVRRDEPQPFARDVSPDEAAAAEPR